ncbi:unnamed protein product [Protopolystoma xenopodis]|uniref:Uncharacterized protein n=1 Tax=Protopolystoma xenopodis TaxID=117903 RepID=A0A448X3M7_9PLAT|nr:unnamed protein product [Protopolystoma xenopodis]
MRFSSDDDHQMMDENSARFHSKRGKRSRGLHQPERCMKAKRLQYNGIQPSSTGEIDLRISSLSTFERVKVSQQC